MRVRFTPRAFQDRERIFDYFAQRSPTDVANVTARLQAVIHRLAEQPESGYPENRSPGGGDGRPCKPRWLVRKGGAPIGGWSRRSERAHAMSDPVPVPDALNAELRRRFSHMMAAGRPFLEVFRECMGVSATMVAADKLVARAERAARLVERLEHALADGDGGDAIAEAGVWRGFSARLMALVAAHHRPGWRGAGLVLVDSFQGLSAARVEDAVLTPEGPMVARHATNFESDVDVVRRTLDGFPEASIHAGWIPAVLAEIPERVYRYVHLDTDLFEPTAACLEYFSARMAPGGVIVDDDYGSSRFPGVRRAWDGFVAAHPGGFETLESGQCAWTAPAGASGPC